MPYRLTYSILYKSELLAKTISCFIPEQVSADYVFHVIQGPNQQVCTPHLEQTPPFPG